MVRPTRPAERIRRAVFYGQTKQLPMDVSRVVHVDREGLVGADALLAVHRLDATWIAPGQVVQVAPVAPRGVCRGGFGRVGDIGDGDQAEPAEMLLGLSPLPRGATGVAGRR